jgi:hypothetical protein
MPSAPVALGEAASRGSSCASSTTSMPSASRAASVNVPFRAQRGLGRPRLDFIQMASEPMMPTPAMGTR